MSPRLQASRLQSDLEQILAELKAAVKRHPDLTP